MELPLAKCEKCGLDVAPGTGASLHIPGQEPWGCHSREYCPAAPSSWDAAAGPARIYMPEEDYEFGSEGDYRADLRDDVLPRIQNGGTFKRSEFDRRPGQRIWKHTVNVGSGIDDWEDAACDG